MAKRILSSLMLVSWVAGIALGGLVAQRANAGDLPLATSAVDSAQKAQLLQAYGKLPLFFIQNDGQVESKVKFYEKNSGHATYFTPEGVYLALTKRKALKADPTQLANKALGPQSFKSELVRLSLIEANKNPEIIAEAKQAGKVSTFIGNNPKNWKTDIATYQAIRYKAMYPGVDVRYYGNNSQLEYDVIVQPGADPQLVRFQYQGIKGLKITAAGELEIKLKQGDIVQKKPLIYQEIDGRRVEVEGAFKLLPSNHGKHIYGFQVASYDTNRELVIDPTLVYATYLGGGSTDYGTSIAVDAAGNAYIAGSTESSDFPTVTPIQAAHGSGSDDAFVTKINAAGNALLYSTYLGGAGIDFADGIAVDGLGNAYITGYTNSTNFPAVSPIQAKNGGADDVFVAKINAAGNALLYSTYLGGAGYESAWAIALDSSGNAYITGRTTGNFPTISPIQARTGGGLSDAFVTKINAAGSAWVYSTYLGGTGREWAYGIAVDRSGNAYVTGNTSSTDFPAVSPIQLKNGGGNDVFVTKINAAGSAWVYSTYLGGTGSDDANAIAVDGSGNAYVAGKTNSTDFPTASPIQATLGGGLDAFVSIINPAGNALAYSSYLGGAGAEHAQGIAVDGSGNVYVAGYASSPDLLGTMSIQAYGGKTDAFVAKIFVPAPPL